MESNEQKYLNRSAFPVTENQWADDRLEGLTKVQLIAGQVAAGIGLYYLKNRPKKEAMIEIAEVSVEIAENIILITTPNE